MAAPNADVSIPAQLVRRLLTAQAPQYAELPLREVAHGWDNVMFRLGDQLAVRLPRREVAARLTAGEQRWLGELPSDLGIPIPVPRFVGEPGEGFPWHWSIVPWFDGETLDARELRAGEAERLGRFFRRLHQPAPDAAPTNLFRGVPFSERPPGIDDRIARCEDWLQAHGFEARMLPAMWRRCASVPVDGGRRWLHGDPHPKNLIAKDGRLVAVVDWGDLCAGDPATDLAAAWMIFDGDARRRFFTAYGSNDTNLLERGRGWAITLGTLLLLTGLDDDPVFQAVGERTLRALLTD